MQKIVFAPLDFFFVCKNIFCMVSEHNFYLCNDDVDSMLDHKFHSFNNNGLYPHSSEIRGLCLMKCPSETLQNLPYFIYTKTKNCIFHFVLLYFSPNECPGKFWSISLGRFIKHKPLISEECPLYLQSNKS